MALVVGVWVNIFYYFIFDILCNFYYGGVVGLGFFIVFVDTDLLYLYFSFFLGFVCHSF